MYVTKRNGNKEFVHFDKITSRISKLIYDLDPQIDPAVITQKTCSSMYSGISTTELDNLACQICMGMISEHPDYGILGSRIAISNHQKNTPENFSDVMKILHENKDMHGDLCSLVSDDLFKISQEYETELQNIIDLNRDYLLDFFGFKTLERSYLLKINTESGVKKIIERPQHLFLRVAIGIHGDNLELVKETYDAFSLKQFTHATPTLFNAGTNTPQLSSCFLGYIEDSIEGIFDSYRECGIISKFAGGIGIHISDIRSKGSYIRKTGGSSDGLMPLLKTFNSVARQFNQGGKRLGSFAMYLEVFHADIFTFLEAKKNVGSDDERARDLFYALWVCDLFMQKIEKNEDWYLMDPNKCPGLPDVYGEEFNQLYNRYVSEGKYEKKIKARELWEAIIGSQIEHGMPYICYKDHVNRKTNQKNLGTIRSSNLCAEINLYSDVHETSVCNLASICLPSILEFPNHEDGDNYIKWYNLLNEDEKIRSNCLFGDLKIFTKKDCEYCKLLKALLTKSKLDFEEIDEEEAEKLRLMSNPSVEKPFETVPQLFSVLKSKDIKHIGGYDDCWKILHPRINYKKLEKMAYNLVLNLNKVIDINYYPVEKTRVSNMRHRPLGIGVQGLANVFMMLRLPFTSDEARKINKYIFETIYWGAMRGSLDMAKIDGAYSTFKGSPLSEGKFQFDLWNLKKEELSGMWNWDEMREEVVKHGVRNSVLISLMPTASTASIFGNVESFEPVTSNLYTRNVLSGVFTIINKHLISDLIDLELWNKDMTEQLMYYKGSVQNISGLPKKFKEIYKTVFEIDQKLLIKMSAERAPFVCQSQSLNLFFDKPSFKDLTSCHFFGWKSGLKTGSYYIRTKAAVSGQNFGMDINKEKMLKKIAEEEEKECINCSA
jgi:ribonucleoside-diphosphate reductase alpha subunit